MVHHTAAGRRFDLCTTCGNQYDLNDIEGTHPYRHPVNGLLPSEDKSSSEDRVNRLPTDPILRLALIDKGVLTPQDLTDAEAKLKASGGIAIAEYRESDA